MPKFNLRTPTGRRTVPAGTKLHIAPLPTPGLSIGYRKSESIGGVFFARKYRDEIKKYITQRIGLADNTQPADGITIFSFEQAVKEAEKWNAQETGLVPTSKHYTVRNVMNDYLAHQELTKRKSLRKVKRRIETHILSALGDVPLRKLTHHQVENWLHNLAKSLPRTRGRQNQPCFRSVVNVDDEEYRRKRQASANTTWNLFKAALNYGYKTGKVSNRGGWDKVQSFRAVNEPKVVEISFAELTAIIDACEPDFQHLVKTALYTGARVSELHRMRVRDFNIKTRKVLLPKTKGNVSRYVFLHAEALELFIMLTKGRNPDDVIFLKDGEPWTEGSQQYPMYNACDAAGVTRQFTIHQLRHQCACICLENGMTMGEVSRMLGHKSIAVTEKFYARYSADYLQDKVERFAPRLRSDGPQNAPDGAARVIAFPKAVGAS